MLVAKIQQDQLIALKSKDEETLSVLRFLSAAIKNKEIELQHNLSDQEALSVIRKQIKQLADASFLFKTGGRIDLVAENDKQIAILSRYVPEEMSDEALTKEIKDILQKHEELHQSNPNALFGVVVKELREKADPSRITKLLKELL